MEEDHALAESMAAALRMRGHDVSVAPLAEAGIGARGADRADIVVLGLPVTRMTEWEACREVAQGSQLGLVVVGPRRGGDETVVALKAGADAYLHKPVSLRVLVALVEAVGRRFRSDRWGSRPDGRKRCGGPLAGAR